jgi:DNA-directed RNA polymerase alpha subunit
MIVYFFAKPPSKALESLMAKQDVQILEIEIPILAGRPPKVIFQKVLAERKKFPSPAKIEEILSLRFDSIVRSTRLKNCFRIGHFITVGDLMKITKEKELLRYKNAGRVVVLEARNILRSLGLDFPEYLSEKEQRIVQRVLDKIWSKSVKGLDL